MALEVLRTQWGTPQHDAGKSFSSIVCNLNCTYSISPFWRWTPSKQYWSALFPLFTKYGSHLGPRESTEQTILCSPNCVIKIQYLLPFNKTMIKVPRPSESIWSGLMVPLLPIRDHSKQVAEKATKQHQNCPNQSKNCFEIYYRRTNDSKTRNLNQQISIQWRLTPNQRPQKTLTLLRMYHQ